MPRLLPNVLVPGAAPMPLKFMGGGAVPNPAMFKGGAPMDGKLLLPLPTELTPMGERENKSWSPRLLVEST